MKDLHAADPVNDVHARREEVLREAREHQTEIGREPDPRFDGPDKDAVADGLMNVLLEMLLERDQAIRKARAQLKGGRAPWRKCRDARETLEGVHRRGSAGEGPS